VQFAWLLLLMCASPRCVHVLRTTPPSLSRAFAQGHDEQMREALASIVGRPEVRSIEVLNEARCSLPFALGGLAFRSALSTAPAAYWGSVADALPEIQKHFPSLVEMMMMMSELTPESDSAAQDAPARAASLAEASAARELLVESGYIECPPWHDIRAGARPDQHSGAEPGEWAHGWQYMASSQVEQHYTETRVLPFLRLLLRPPFCDRNLALQLPAI